MGSHAAVDDAIALFVEGFRNGLWDPLRASPKCCHMTADCILYLLAREFRFEYAGTQAGKGNMPSSSSLSDIFVARRLHFATHLDPSEGAEAPVAMLRLSLSCGRSRLNTHTLACVVHRGYVRVLQADRGRFSLHDWVQEDADGIPASMESAHRKYGGARWVAVAEFVDDVIEHRFLPMYRESCPRVVNMSVLVHETRLGTRTSRGFDDTFVHGSRVERVLPLMAYSVGQTLKGFVERHA